MPRTSRSRTSAAGIGSRYLLKLAVLVTGLMILNSYVVGLVVQANAGWFPMILKDIRVFQFCQVLLPFLLVLLQFWIYDRIKERYFVFEEPARAVDS